MHRWLRSSSVLLLTLLLASTALCGSPAVAESSDDFLRLYAETNRFRNGLPASIEMTPTGNAVFYLRSPGKSLVRDLWVFDPRTAEERRVLTAGELLGAGEEELSAEEKARRERMRVSARGIASYSLSADGSSILAPLSGRLFVVSWPSEEVRELTVEGGFPIDPRFSPDGRHVAYGADGDLWILDVESDEPRRLRAGEGPEISYGVPEFVAQEEMDRDHGYWWSPDGSKIAFQRSDDSELETFYIADPSNPAKEPRSWRYPRAGTANTDVRLGILPVDAKEDGGADAEPVWVEWDRETYPYLATVKWNVEGAPLTILVQDRAQQEEVLYAVDEATGETTELLRETDDAWLNLYQDYPRWLDGGEAFLWLTERGGSKQIELRAADGSLLRTVTGPSLRPTKLAHVSAERMEAIVVGQGSALDSQVYLLDLEGKDRPRALTSGQGMKSVEVSESGFVRVFHLMPPEEPDVFVVRDGAGNPFGVLPTEQEWPEMEIRAEYESVGVDPKFHSVLVRPEDFDDALHYPVIVHVYGGPHKQMVERAARDRLLDQWLANQGFVVVSIDGRGTPNRGREWERAIRGNFIDQPLSDQAFVLEVLGDRFPALDLERVGIYGWSFGGYFSAMAVMRRPDVFDAGAAGAPVTDWHDYDTHYTERYVGHPEEFPEAYEVSNVLTYAADLERPLLILHGTADDNVYFVHGLKMSNALLRAGIEHEFLPLAGQTHMVSDPDVVVPIYRRHVEFFEEHLGTPEPR